jgi:hypothetical protein
MSIANMRDAATSDEQSESDPAGFYSETFDQPLPQSFSDARRIRGASRLAGRLAQLPMHDLNGRAEIIATVRRAFAVPRYSPQAHAWADDAALETGAYKPKREMG